MQQNLTSDDIAGDPTNLPIRAHEIIEDAMRDHLSGIDDEGSGAAYAETYADTQVDKVVLGELASLIDARSPGLVETADSSSPPSTRRCARSSGASGSRSPGTPSPTASRSTPRSATCSRPSPRSPTCSRSRRPRPDGARDRAPVRYPPAPLAATPRMTEHPRTPAAAISSGARRRRGRHRGRRERTARRGPRGRGRGEPPPPATADSYPFHGANQSGVLTPGPAASRPSPASPPSTRPRRNKAELAELMQTITARARFLTAGGVPENLGISQPPSDSDVLGPVVPADGLTVTLGLGASLFDERYGLASLKPSKLKPMTIFPNDSPEPAWMHGDLMIQLCANHPDTIHHAIRDLAKHTRGGMQLRWKIEGYGTPPRPSGTPRNLLGFKDGTANPTGELARTWCGPRPASPRGRQRRHLVVRLIRMLVEFWDRVSINEQEGMFGRRRDSGAPLDGNNEFDTPDYSADPNGNVIPLDSHIRLANPRTSQTANQRLIRRSYNYDLGIDQNGDIQAGHIFVAYNQDLERQFETVQRRLIGEPLIDYVQPFGGGYFYAVPGVATPTTGTPAGCSRRVPGHGGLPAGRGRRPALA